MEPTRTTQGLQMLTFFKKQPSASDEKEQAKALFQKIVSAEIAKTFGEKSGTALLKAIEDTK